jgi:excisionase family DNA binding protein
MTTTPASADEQLLLSVPQAAARLGIGRSLLYNAITRGHLRSVRIGGRRLIRPDDLTAYVESLDTDGEPTT